MTGQPNGNVVEDPPSCIVDFRTEVTEGSKASKLVVKKNNGTIELAFRETSSYDGQTDSGLYVRYRDAHKPIVSSHFACVVRTSKVAENN